MRIASLTLSCALVACLSACGGGDDPAIDAGGGSGSGSAEPACTGKTFDPCTDVSQCLATNPGGANCKTFNGLGFQVCAQTCTFGDDTTCPVQEGQQSTCNMMGICKPIEENKCTR